jgi:hypothetical protein
VTTELPEPPVRLPDLADAHVIVLPIDWPLLRAHDIAGTHPRAFNELRWWGPIPDKGRFDHHPVGAPRDHFPAHGVVYVACPDPGKPPAGLTASDAIPGNALDVVLAEMVQADHELTVTPGLTLTAFSLSEPLHLLDVRGTWAQATRAGAHLSTAPHHDVQRWARAIRAAYPQLNGVLYAPSTGGHAVAVVLNESSERALSEATVLLSRQMTDPALEGVLNAAARRLQITLTMP